MRGRKNISRTDWHLFGSPNEIKDFALMSVEIIQMWQINSLSPNSILERVLLLFGTVKATILSED